MTFNDELLQAAKMGKSEFSDFLKLKRDEFKSQYGSIRDRLLNINSELTLKNYSQKGAIDLGQGYKVSAEMVYGKNGTGNLTYILTDKDGNEVGRASGSGSSIRNSLTSQFSESVGYGQIGSNASPGTSGFADMASNYAKKVGDTDLSNGAYEYWDKQFQDAKEDGGNFGVFINNFGKEVTADSFAKAQDMKRLGFPLKDSGSLSAEQQKQLSQITAPTGERQDLAAIASGQYASLEEYKAAKNAEAQAQTEAQYGNKYQYASSEAQAQSTGQPYIPGYKGIYSNAKDKNANNAAVNDLFQQYHGRDANQQELDYWSGKKVGDLEDTLAKTAIFSGEDADKIRAQMQAEGKTYIANQAELENLAKSGGISDELITQVGGQTGMMFTSTANASNTGSITGGAPTTPATNTTGTGQASGTTGGATGGLNSEDDLINTIVDAVGDPNASEIDILNALNTVKESQVDPYYKQLIGQVQQDVTTQVNRLYEDRIRELQSQAFNMAENIRGAQKSLEASGMTFSGEAIRKLGTLSAFAQPTPEALTPEQLGQTTKPTELAMTPEQAGIEGVQQLGNRLLSEQSRTQFNRALQDINKQAVRTLGTEGAAVLGLQNGGLAQPQTTGQLQYDYANTLQNVKAGLTNQEQTLTNYQQQFL